MTGQDQVGDETMRAAVRASLLLDGGQPSRLLFKWVTEQTLRLVVTTFSEVVAGQRVTEQVQRLVTTQFFVDDWPRVSFSHFSQAMDRELHAVDCNLDFMDVRPTGCRSEWLLHLRWSWLKSPAYIYVADIKLCRDVAGAFHGVVVVPADVRLR